MMARRADIVLPLAGPEGRLRGDQHLIAPKQIETALGYGIHHTFSSDYRTVSTALNSGVPLSMTTGSDIAAQFDQFTRQLVGMGQEAVAVPERKRVFLGMF